MIGLTHLFILISIAIFIIIHSILIYSIFPMLFKFALINSTKLMGLFAILIILLI